MREGEASLTAQRVAAYRLSFDRLPAPYGDPAADEALARNVAQQVEVVPGGMHDYLRARTAFFDRVVVDALAAGIAQVVVGAAGYDGRAWRYGKPGVRWIELDHPTTQRDKLERMHRLGLRTDHVCFVAADFAIDAVADRLLSAGLDVSSLCLFLLEGVAVYLDRPVLVSLLEGFRHVAADGSRLAISFSVMASSTQRAARRAAFQAAVAAMGEPVRSVTKPGDIETLLAATGWQMVVASGHASSSIGLVLAETLRLG
jgi:methyltransferase (TIGR00027 family)